MPVSLTVEQTPHRRERSLTNAGVWNAEAHAAFVRVDITQARTSTRLMIPFHAIIRMYLYTVGRDRPQILASSVTFIVPAA